MSKTDKIAIIDLGTSSIRLEIYQLLPSSAPELLVSKRGMPRLGEDAFETGRLSEEAIIRTIGVLSDFNKIAEENLVGKIYALGTSVLREVQDEDAKSFISRAKEESGIEIEIISGAREASLIAKAFIAFEKVPEHTYALVDIGGGSTELNICRGSEILSSRSLPIGSTRLHQLFLRANPPEITGDFDSRVGLRNHVKEVLSQISVMEFGKIESLFGTSGSIKTLSILPDVGSDGIIELLLLRSLNERMGSLRVEEIREIPQMDYKRADLILAGSLLFEEIMDFFCVKHAKASRYSLRHGMLAEILN